MKISELPYEINKKLCTIFDNNSEWTELAKFMKYNDSHVKEIESRAIFNRSSPSFELFKDWGQYNHTAEELFALCLQMRHVTSLKCLIEVLKGEKFCKALNALCAKLAAKDAKNGLPVDKNEKPPYNVQNATKFQEGANSMDTEIKRQVVAIPNIDYEELRRATDNWHIEKKLGTGGFAQVFKGIWKELPVAVKRLTSTDSASHRELIRELCLNQYRHDNLVPLYGYSFGGPHVCLVYQLMLGGSLNIRLHQSRVPLLWRHRLSIALGVARGLQFLHTMSTTPLIHGDIKPANILLDQFLIPKIGDFGLARKGPGDISHIRVLEVNGTRPYLPPEYLTSGELSLAVDVYSFGVVLLEMATGLKVHDPARPAPLLADYIRIHTADVAEIEDRRLYGTPESSAILCRAIIALGKLCTREKRPERPSMLVTYQFLAKIMSQHTTKPL